MIRGYAQKSAHVTVTCWPKADGCLRLQRVINPLTKPMRIITSSLPIFATMLICSGCVTQAKSPSSSINATSAQVTPALPAIDTAAAQRLLSVDQTLQTLDLGKAGSQIVTGRIVGHKSASYALLVRAGQRLDVTMDTPSDAAYFNVQDVRDQSGAAVFAGEMSSAHYGSVRATSDTTYLIRPYLNRGVARRGTSADYTLKIELH